MKNERLDFPKEEFEELLAHTAKNFLNHEFIARWVWNRAMFVMQKENQQLRRKVTVLQTMVDIHQIKMEKKA